MDPASSVVALLPPIAVALVCVVAFCRRRQRTSPLIVNPYTLVVEPDVDALGNLPVVRLLPPTTTSQSVPALPPPAAPRPSSASTTPTDAPTSRWMRGTTGGPSGRLRLASGGFPLTPSAPDLGRLDARSAEVRRSDGMRSERP